MQGGHTFSVEQAYNISYKKNSHWGIEGYDIVKVYQDPSRQVKQREYLTQKKGQKNKSYVTKRGHYLEDYAKEKKGIPEPNKYNIETKWPDPKAKPQRPSSTQPKKQTYIDDIVNEQKRRPIPGPGKYDPIKTLEQLKKEQDELKKKHVSEGERPTYLNEYEFQANYPGPGQYNPHAEVPKDKQNNTNPKYWIEKHKKVPTPVKFPCVGTYAPILDETFEKMSKEKPCQKKVSINPNKIWGAEDRFKDVKKSKSLVKDGPGPGQYAVTEEWLGKTTKKETQKKPLSQYITRGISKSIYY